MRAQWRELGLPRCGGMRYGATGPLWPCQRLIWPWQGWVAEIDEGPQHHDCYHRHLVFMRGYVIEDDAKHGRHSADYSVCGFCGKATAA